MQVPHNSFVLVADGRKALLFRNQGDADHPNLQVEHAEEHADRPDREQKTDAAGGAPAASRGTMGETDYHQQAEDRFAAEIADMLKQRALTDDYEALIIVAPPKALGELRKHYHKEVSARLRGELAKDLTGHSVSDIEQALRSA